MTKFHIKTILLAAATLALAITGCKKEDEYPYLSLYSTSIDFEWAQTKEVGFTSRLVTGYGTPTVPTGWSCHRDGNKFIITSPAQSAVGAETTGKIKINYTTKNGDVSQEISVAIKIASEIPSGANSMIVSRPGSRYKFFARRRGNETSGTSLSAATGATVVWKTSKTVLSNISLEGDYLYFSTADTAELEEGNALVAVTDGNSVVLWSWHIWITTFDPAAEPDYYSGATVMNRNLGALANSNATPAEAALSYGLYYQWGRKDPFVGPAVWNSNVPRPLYNVNGAYSTHSYNIASNQVDTNGDGKLDNVAGSLEFATAYPNTFIAGLESSDFDWLLADHNTTAWSPTSKTIHDPCPVGWRVAPPTIWNDLTTTGALSSDPTEFNVEGEYTYGWTFSLDSGIQYHPPQDPDVLPPDPNVRVFYPAAGRRSFSPTLATPEDNYTNIVNDGDGIGHPKGFYWSATTSAALVFRNDYINPATTTSSIEEHALAGAFPLRCIAE